jgi:outer membrane protein assembly factor BamD
VLGSLLAMAVFLPLAACDSLNPFDKGEVYKPEVKPDIPAEKLYNDGLAALEQHDYEGSTKAFKDINKTYPYSQWSKKALLMETYSHYLAKEFEEASSSGKRYLQLYPADADAAYAAYLIASSYNDAVLDVSRDQDRAEKALVAYMEVVQRWPKSDYANDSKAKIAILRDQLAAREMNVGRFYLNKRNYTAAINRFRIVVSQYQTTNQIEEALARLTESYLALGIVNEAETAAAVLGHNFPESQWYKDTFALLQSKGAAPKENEDSWITKAFKAVKIF